MIEIITVIAIFGIVSSVVLFNHGKFTSETILTNMAYEVALSVREAQVYGVSVRAGESASFDVPYGIYIPPISGNDTKEYILFADYDSSNNFSDPSCEIGVGEECITPYTFQRNIFISGTDVQSGNSENCVPGGVPNSGMHIVFVRPNPEPVLSIGSDPSDTFTQVQITIETTDGAKRYIVISNNGQISVQNEPICT